MDIVKDAVLSRDKIHRYRLTRSWGTNSARVCFIMLNPSTADAEIDDPTIRRCMGFAKSWEYGGIIVVNLYAKRATDPRNLIDWQPGSQRRAVGYDNNRHILQAAKEAQLVVTAWGASWTFGRCAEVNQLLALAGIERTALKVCKNGEPGHPLYLKKTSYPERWYGCEHEVE